LDAQGEQASAWRTTRHAVNRLSLTLERMGRLDQALREIEAYEATADRVGISRQDAQAVAKRKARLIKKLGAEAACSHRDTLRAAGEQSDH
jgi:hypothetical protein